MSVAITIPSPGESINEVVLGTWHKSDGDWVEKDEPLVEIESDKATLDLPSPESGLLHIDAQPGDELKVGATIGTIDENAKQPAAKSGDTKATKPQAAVEAKSTRAEEPAPGPASHAAVATENAQSRATSVAKKIAEERGIDLANVRGTGPSGRVTKSDVLGATPVSATQRDGLATSAPRPIAQTTGERGVRRERMSTLRKRIAERLVAAQHNAAMLTTFNEADMSAVMSLRKKYKDEFLENYGVNLGFMSFFVKACVSALQHFERVNAYIVDGEIEYHDFCDVSVAVGTDKGLVVPVIRDAHKLSFADIEATIKDFAIRAKEGKLSIDEMTGGTFTISNGGVYGSLNSTPILNPPQSGILGMHKIMNRPIENPEKPGEIVLRPMMNLAMSYDHRIVDGAEAVGFLVHVKNAIENPERLLLGM